MLAEGWTNGLRAIETTELSIQTAALSLVVVVVLADEGTSLGFCAAYVEVAMMHSEVRYRKSRGSLGTSTL